ncbi:MAG: hypothetical protein ACM3UT_11345 [Chloroflexota bacterium]
MYCYPNLLIISGTSRKSGKTTMACRLIKHFRDLAPVAIKISPHFHEVSPGLLAVDGGPGFAVYEETNADSDKDTSRMLKAGAGKVFLILAWDADVMKIFKKVIEGIPKDTPVLCESPTLRKYFEPGAFIIMSSDNPDRTDMEELLSLPHIKMNLDMADKEIPVKFVNGEWIF